VSAVKAAVNSPITTPTHTIISAAPFVDLTGTFGTTWTLPASVVTGKLLFGNVSVVLSNLGNVALATGQTVNINFVAHDTTNPVNPDVTLLAMSSQSIGGLAAGR